MIAIGPAHVDTGQLSAAIDRHLGLHFPPEHAGDLLRGVSAAAGDLGFADAASFAAQILSAHLSRRQVDVLASHLTVGETFFFRDHAFFDALEQSVLPDLIRTRTSTSRQLRIWSAGCSTGEEAYSIAICVHRLVEQLRDWEITILATDVNPKGLEHAQRAVYREWSFRETPAAFRDRHFTRTSDGYYALRPVYRSMVTFAPLNLVEDVYPSLLSNTNAMDLIVCRNVLMYLSSGVRAHVLRRMHRCLLNDGWLATSRSEAFTPFVPDFTPVPFPGITLYRKEHHAGPRNARTDDTIPAPPPPSAAPPAIPPSAESSALLTRAQALLDEGLYAQAADQAAAVLTAQPGSVPALELMARSCADLGRLHDALTWCDRAIAGSKLDSHLHYLRAEILQELGMAAEARAALRNVLYLDPRSVLAHFSMGTLARRLGRPAEARKSFRNAGTLLRAGAPDAIVPDSDGMTAQRLAEIVETLAEEPNAP